MVGEDSTEAPTAVVPILGGQALGQDAAAPKLCCGLTYEAAAKHPALSQAGVAHQDLPLSPPALPEKGLARYLEELNHQFFLLHVDLRLFDSLESTPLTQEQGRSVICFDNELTVVAAASSAKTTTMPLMTQVCSLQSNGMVESFMKTIKRDYNRHMPKPDRAAALRNPANAFKHYNEEHPHSALNYRSPGEFRRLAEE